MQTWRTWKLHPERPTVTTGDRTKEPATNTLQYSTVWPSDISDKNLKHTDTDFMVTSAAVKSRLLEKAKKQRRFEVRLRKVLNMFKPLTKLLQSCSSTFFIPMVTEKHTRPSNICVLASTVLPSMLYSRSVGPV